MAQESSRLDESSGKLTRLKGVANAAWCRATEKSQAIYHGAREHADQITDQYQNSRAREYVEAVLKQTGQGLDTISGKAMYELVRDRLDLQDRYNDLLATKLQEALDRIQALETKLAAQESVKDNVNDV